MSGAGGVVFILCALVAFLSAIGTVALKSPLRAAMSLLAHILSLAGLYLTLHAHLIAAVQLIVYAGAVVVLFVFVIMLIGPTEETKATFNGFFVRLIAACLMGLLGSSIVFSLVGIEGGEKPQIAACSPQQGPECQQFGGVEALGKELFTKASLPFEIVSILLTVAIIGAIAIARARTEKETSSARARRLEHEAHNLAAKKAAATIAAAGGE